MFNEIILQCVYIACHIRKLTYLTRRLVVTRWNFTRQMCLMSNLGRSNLETWWKLTSKQEISTTTLRYVVSTSPLLFSKWAWTHNIMIFTMCVSHLNNISGPLISVVSYYLVSSVPTHLIILLSFWLAGIVTDSSVRFFIYLHVLKHIDMSDSLYLYVFTYNYVIFFMTICICTCK